MQAGARPGKSNTPGVSNLLPRGSFEREPATPGEETGEAWVEYQQHLHASTGPSERRHSGWGSIRVVGKTLAVDSAKGRVPCWRVPTFTPELVSTRDPVT